ncbi:MAG: heat-inducible transcriptional repressor HrcA [Gammaproteobacteria bacterium]|nr:heat-inducible transcriptional repressor HrcA [Gammaproteobacteria bacterium]
MSKAAVNPRAQQILKVLVERYIQDGAPVGSRTIAEESALGLSSATIRNILADLEDGGYLTSPHTSAGRIPTAQGYRLFVNSLLSVTPLENHAVQALKSQLDPDMTMPNLLQSASSLLSGLTQMIGVVALPRRNRIELRQVEFLPLSSNRVLVILVLNNREVQNRIIYTERTYSQSELQQAANYLNAHYIGKDLLDARKELMHAMQSDRDNMAGLLQTAMEVADKAFVSEDDKKDYVMAGQNNLLGYTKKDELERLYSLFQAFTQKQEILNLLDHSLEAEGIQIFIGRESGYEAFNNCSIVTTSYAVDGQLIGSLGVIGPTRMPYDRVISAVDVTAKLLSAALNQG